MLYLAKIGRKKEAEIILTIFKILGVRFYFEVGSNTTFTGNTFELHNDFSLFFKDFFRCLLQ